MNFLFLGFFKRLGLGKLLTMIIVIFVILPLFLKDKYAKPIVETREELIHEVKQVGKSIKKNMNN